MNENLSRTTCLLTLRRLEGSHTHDILAKAIDAVYIQFEISDKLSYCTTDIGSNFKKWSSKLFIMNLYWLLIKFVSNKIHLVNVLITLFLNPFVFYYFFRTFGHIFKDEHTETLLVKDSANDDLEEINAIELNILNDEDHDL